jgi:hypothetical protein
LKKSIDLLAADSAEEDEQMEGQDGNGRASAEVLPLSYLLMCSSCTASLKYELFIFPFGLNIMAEWMDGVITGEVPNPESRINSGPRSWSISPITRF